ncbi:MAG: hypothetical protein Q7U28_13145 [Aquabacterium sp.]|nr:hypothetical protein [Aquabacterium sp.]
MFLIDVASIGVAAIATFGGFFGAALNTMPEPVVRIQMDRKDSNGKNINSLVSL